MTIFDDTGRQLHQIQRQQAITGLNLRLAQEHLAQAQAAQQQLARYFDPQNPDHQARQQALQAQQAQATTTIQQLTSTLAEVASVNNHLATSFLPFTDPRENLRFKSTDYPILLFPLRLETRFKAVAVPGSTATEQLWVRVYPDECLVDTFEPLPSESELTSVQKFWVDWALAGGVDGEQRGAWRTLVAGSGSGRAAWLIQQYRPDLTQPSPQKTDYDVILAIATEQPLPTAEKPAVEAFWIAGWQANGSAAAQQTAWETLVVAIGAERAAVVRDLYAPVNLAVAPPAPLTHADARVAIAWLEFPDRSQTDSQQQPWSQAPRVTVLPERLVLVGYRNGEKVLEQLGSPIPMPLIAGPNPLATDDDQLHLENGNIVVSDAMRWMVDFDRAIEVGMGFRVNLSPEDRERGFDQLLVVGVRLSADAAAGQVMVETLFQHHETGNSGFSLVPQGTPTNNTEGAGSGFSEREDADDTYDLVFNTAPLTSDPDWRLRSDGQWLADLLGIRLSTFDRTLHARGRDQCEARAMNTALWPGTWGYFMESMMTPVFDAATIEATRWFFTHFVSARGLLPAIRIGDQPYGILPTTVFSRMTWLRGKQWPRPQGVPHPSNYRSYLLGLHQVLETMRADWQTQLPKVAHLGKSGDPHQILLDILGLHPTSAEYYLRHAESLEQLTNRLKLQGFWGQFIAALMALGYPQSGMDLLARLGYTEDAIPEILEKFFLNQPDKLLGDRIDDQPLSETNPIRAYTEDDRNYIRWLIDTAQTSFDALRKEEGFTENRKPTALLYLMLRYALEQGYWDAGLRLLESAELLSPAQLAAARLDPSFIHVGNRAVAAPPQTAPNTLKTSGKPVRLDQRSESRYEYLYQSAPTLTNNPSLLVADYIPRILSQLPATRYLHQQIEALQHLEQTPTARLERLFAEHVDLCTYRLDAWRWGLLHYQLLGMRYGNLPAPPTETEDVPNPSFAAVSAAVPPASTAPPLIRQGVYLGAFGILEQVKSEDKQLTPVNLDAELEAIFNPPNTDLPPLMRDSTNGGFIHAPSLNHAITAAVLRNGYIANATPDNPDLLKVNLSSERVRRALGIIEGIRNGQTLGALLGYQLERGLHDRHPEAEVDQFIYELRKAFPLVANRFKDTQGEANDPIQALEARNVINGYTLVEQIQKSGIATYPFGKSSLPSINLAESTVINSEVDRILDLHDAVADLVLAEGVFQAVQGNYGRVASNLDAYAKGTFPPEPEVVQTPRSGINLTHRLGLHLQPGLDPAVSPNGIAVTPRAHAEPALNAWLDRTLPDPSTVFCKATYLGTDGSAHTVEISQPALGLQPLDLIYLLNPEANQAMTELDDQVMHYVLTSSALVPPPCWDGDITLQYVFKESGKVSFFELGALIHSLRRVILQSRPLNATDVAMPTEAQESAAAQVTLDENRLTPLVTQLGALVTHPNPGTDDLNALIADIALWLPDPETHRDDMLGAIDGWIDRMMALFAQVATFGIPQASSGFAYNWKKQQLRALRSQIDVLVERWEDKLSRFNTLLTVDYPTATTDEARIPLLRQAESLVSTELTVPLPATVTNYRIEVEAKATTFESVLNAFRALQTAPTTTLAQLRLDILAQLPLDAYDYQPFDLATVEGEILRFVGDLYAQVNQLQTAVVRRQTTANDQILAALALSNSPAQVEGLVKAAKTLLGEDFKIVPEFTLAPDQAREWGNAWVNRAEILTYLTDAEPGGLGRTFPVDEWLYGVARVRENAAHWERILMLSQAFGTGDPTLEPIQLPYKAGDHWLAMSHPPHYSFDSDHLLYTAHYAVPFNPSAAQCGLLLDEWTEVIPTREETTGITFNYDRPNAEPPQTLLLVTSPHLEGDWRWEDLVDAIRETLEEARLRAIEPTQIDDTSYARFLPATLSAVTFHPITIMLNLALNNAVYSLISPETNA